MKGRTILHRKLTALMTAAVLLVCSGCSDSESSQNTAVFVSESTEAGTQTTVTEASSAPEVTTTAVTEPFLAEPRIPMTESVRLLNALHVPGTVSGVFAGGGDTVVVQYGTEKKQQYAVADLMQDTLTETGTLVSAEEKIAGRTPSGEIVSPEYRYSVFTGTIRFYKDGSSRTVKVTPRLRKITYSAAHDCLYAFDIEQKDLIRISTDGTETVLFRLNERSDYLNISPEQQLFLTAEMCAELGICSEVACRSLQTGEILWQKPAGSEISGGFTNGGIYTEEVIFDSDMFDDVYDGAYVSRVYTRADGTDCGGVKMPDLLGDYTPDQTGDYRAALSVSITEAAMRFTDLASGRYTELEFPVSSVTKAIPFFSAETGRWVTAVTNQASGKTCTDLCLVNPQISDGAQTAETAAPLTPEAHHPCDASLADARKFADFIEQKYGVRVLIGNEVLDLPERSDEEIQTTEDYWKKFLDMSPELRDDPFYASAQVNSILEQLAWVEQKMSKYPEGFFRSFRTPEGKGGLRISIFQRLYTFARGEAGGIANTFGAWYDMRLTEGRAFDHEMFHLVEFRTNWTAQYEMAFPEEGDNAWIDYCPNGFRFNEKWNTAEAGEELNQYLLFNSRENAYFVSRYSMTEGVEDRAEIMNELFKVPEAQWLTAPAENNLKVYEQCPHLMKKLTRMAETVRKTFGSVYWEEIFAAGYDPRKAEQAVQALIREPGCILDSYGL